MKKVYFIRNIEEYGKLIAFCIENDISVFRTYWDERERGNRCYCIDWNEKRCLYSSLRFFQEEGYEILTPIFYFDQFGVCKIGK